MSSPLGRRSILLASAALVGAVSTQQSEGRSYSGAVPWSAGEASSPKIFEPGELKFFTPSEASFIDAAVARLIPADELGPGAREAGVMRFLDRQLAGTYGRAETWYMQGPWHDGSKSQGYQSNMTPAELYRAAIKAIDDHCRRQFGGKAFSEATPGQQDEILTGLEKGKIKLDDVGSQSVGVEGTKKESFFATLMQNTIEGFFCDPVHGGNRDMIGWKLIGFPGAHYDYRPYVNRHNEKVDVKPVGILGKPEWSTDHS